MNEAVENVVGTDTDNNVTLRGRCAQAHLPYQDMRQDNVTPVPTLVPGDFTVRLGDVMPGWVQQGLEEEFGRFGGAAAAAQGFLSWIHWVEVEVQGYEDLLEGLSRLKGALMAAATVAVGEW